MIHDFTHRIFNIRLGLPPTLCSCSVRYLGAFWDHDPGLVNKPFRCGLFRTRVFYCPACDTAWWLTGPMCSATSARKVSAFRYSTSLPKRRSRP